MARARTWWTHSCGPIDVEGRVGGVPEICNDATAHHLATDASKDQTVRLQKLFEQAPTFSAVSRGPDDGFELVDVAYSA